MGMYFQCDTSENSKRKDTGCLSAVTVYHGDIYASFPYSPDRTTGKTVFKYDIYDYFGL
jgi:hypothetical protein